jgi:hypothetical protein
MGRNLKDFYTNNPNDYTPGMPVSASDSTAGYHWAKDKKGENVKGSDLSSVGVTLRGGLGKVRAHQIGGLGRDVSAKVTRNRDVKKTGARLAKVAAGEKKPKKSDTFTQQIKKNK